MMKSFGRNQLAAGVAKEGTEMQLQNVISRVKSHLDKQRQYRRAINEISSLSDRDLADMRANRDDMINWARREYLG
ncbi:MAG: DUF1127 domain-containing protein [Mesorhizobium sp.]